MLTFIAYGIHAIALAPSCKGVENFQILSFIYAKTAAEAGKILMDENPWIAECGFSKKRILCCECSEAYGLEFP
jgi:hypothetical protein